MDIPDEFEVKWKSAQRDANTAHPPQSPHRCTESAMALVRQSQKISPPPQTPFPGVQDRQNLISWRWSLTAPTDPVWWRSMHAISSYRGNRHCPPAKTHRQDRLQYTVPLASVQSNNSIISSQLIIVAAMSSAYKMLRRKSSLFPRHILRFSLQPHIMFTLHIHSTCHNFSTAVV